MFPLGSVLFPSVVLPLHVFEPRYRTLVQRVLDGDGEFGVCLIERGSEVGGGDVRLGVGTVAAVQEAAELPDGRWAVMTVGTRRIRVDEWLPDDPHPVARVDDLPDPPPGTAEVALLEPVTGLVRRALAMAAELGEPASPATVELSDDPVLASHQLSALAPVSTIDQYSLLAAPSVGARLRDLHELVTESIEVLDLRLGGDDAP